MKNVVAVLLFAVATAASAAYPERPIRLIVPQAPGAASDTIARIVASEVSRQIGQQLIVDNRPGGALMIGMELVSRATPDGYTIGFGPVGALAISPHVVGKLAFDIEINKALASQTVRERFAALGAEPAQTTPDQFGDLIRREYVKWGDVVRRSRARID